MGIREAASQGFVDAADAADAEVPDDFQLRTAEHQRGHIGVGPQSHQGVVGPHPKAQAGQWHSGPALRRRQSLGARPVVPKALLDLNVVSVHMLLLGRSS